MNFVNMMMTMDPRLSLPTATGQDATGLPTMEGGAADTGFADLLGLVSDMEVAESQDGESGLFADAQIEAMMGRDSQGLQASKMEAQLLMGMPHAAVTPENGNAEQQSVGRISEQVLLGSETRLAQDLSLEGLQGQMTKGQAMQQIPDSDAVAQWSAALATGDIAAVTVEPAKEGPQASELALAGLRARPDAQGALRSESNVKKSALPKNAVTKEAAPELLLSNAKTQSPVRGEAPAKAASSGFEFAAPPKAEASDRVVDTAPKATAFTVAAKGEQSAKSEGNGHGSSSEGRSQERGHGDKAMNAQDFMLERASDMSFATRASGPSAESATVVAASDLGSPQDPRVSSNVVDFVADKVEALRAQGGGTLKVEMSNSDLGGLTMQVSKRLGQVEVRISADRPETQRLLEASKSELTARLADKVGPSLVDVRMASASDFSAATRGSEVIAQATAVRSTEQLLDLRHATLSHEAPTANRAELRDVSMKDASLSKEMGGDGFQRQERRERALNKWEDEVLRQKSA